ncbi:transcriptional regulator [Streptococcus suis]|uniref:transcriptional regulator n=1 Tax=Streptococcus suis TaxID=1307 RepID=UPI0025B16748|nr:transcriptional regulator [Streptococcus suis]MDN2990450.1 transcriptional regulator [Streptococcus suis]
MQHLVRNIHKNYTQLNNHSAQNSELSLQAKGLLLVLMSNKDTWKPYIDELSKRSKNGRDAHRTAYDELKDAGYIRIYQKSLGRRKGVQNLPLVSDIPITDSYWEYWKEKVDDELSTSESSE